MRCQLPVPETREAPAAEVAAEAAAEPAPEGNGDAAAAEPDAQGNESDAAAAAPAEAPAEAAGEAATPATPDRSEAEPSDEKHIAELSDEAVAAALDRTLAYLWLVHGVDYYVGKEFANPDQPGRAAARRTLRPEAPAEGGNGGGGGGPRGGSGKRSAITTTG